MVEVIEYVLVFAVTAALAGFSIMVVQGSLPALDETQGQSEFEQLSGAASVAAVEGSSQVLLPVSNATIACSGGVMTFSSGGQSYSAGIGYPCAFQYSGASGLCRFDFSSEYQAVRLEVSC